MKEKRTGRPLRQSGTDEVVVDIVMEVVNGMIISGTVMSMKEKIYRPSTRYLWESFYRNRINGATCGSPISISLIDPVDFGSRHDDSTTTDKKQRVRRVSCNKEVVLSDLDG